MLHGKALGHIPLLTFRKIRIDGVKYLIYLIESVPHMELLVQLNTAVSTDIVSLYDIRCGVVDGLHIGYLILPGVKNVKIEDQYVAISIQSIIDRSLKTKVTDETQMELYYRLPKLRVFKQGNEVVLFMRFKQENKITDFLL